MLTKVPLAVFGTNPRTISLPLPLRHRRLAVRRATAAPSTGTVKVSAIAIGPCYTLLAPFLVHSFATRRHLRIHVELTSSALPLLKRPATSDQRPWRISPVPSAHSPPLSLSTTALEPCLSSTIPTFLLCSTIPHYLPRPQSQSSNTRCSTLFLKRTAAATESLLQQSIPTPPACPSNSTSAFPPATNHWYPAYLRPASSARLPPAFNLPRRDTVRCNPLRRQHLCRTLLMCAEPCCRRLDHPAQAWIRAGHSSTRQSSHPDPFAPVESTQAISIGRD